MATKPLIPSNHLALAKMQTLTRRARLRSDDVSVELPLAVYDHSKAHPFQIAAASMDARTIAAALEAASLIRGERGANEEQAVYIITPETEGVAKIGVAASPRDRLKAMQTGHWEKLSIAALFWVYGKSTEVEGLALKAAEQAGSRLAGEWVKLSAEEAALHVAEAAASCGALVADSAMWLTNRLAIRSAVEQRREQTASSICGFAAQRFGVDAQTRCIRRSRARQQGSFC